MQQIIANSKDLDGAHPNNSSSEPIIEPDKAMKAMQIKLEEAQKVAIFPNQIADANQSLHSKLITTKFHTRPELIAKL